MTRYLATFSRYRLRLILPVVVALAISSFYAASRPHKYETSMTLWLDTALPSQSSLVGPPQNVSPADQGMQTLKELLGTQQFLVEVGHTGPLARMLGGANPTVTVNGPIVATLNKAFTVSESGPQVLQVTMTGSNPVYMPGTLTAVATEYLNQVTGSLRARDQAIVAYYRSQIASADADLNAANTAVATYRDAHPFALPTSDLAYNQLTQVAFQAQQQDTAAQSTLDQAEITLQNVSAPTQFHIVDQPSAPFRLSNKKHVIFTIVVGLAVGIVISALALSALMALDTTAREPEDIETLLDMDVVGTIHDVSPLRRLPFVRRTPS